MMKATNIFNLNGRQIQFNPDDPIFYLEREAPRLNPSQACRSCFRDFRAQKHINFWYCVAG